MAISLQKGQKINLKKADGSALSNIMVGLGWDAAEKKSGGFLSSIFGSGGNNIDCDASVFLCKHGKLADETDVVYFGNLQHKSGAVKHMGDNLTGDGEGDDEQVFVNLNHLPSDYDRLVFVVNIYKAEERKQHFGMIKNAFIRIVDSDSNTELCRYNLSDNYDGMLAMVAGEVYKKNDEWKFNAIGNGTKDVGLKDLTRRFM
ncbi:MAG: TerD family protein [Selenomonadaceae bacterium]|nr:TerD family protein [Selenomonadaceae bacterium]